MSRFLVTPVVASKIRQERIAHALLALVLISILIPLLAIVAHLFWRAAPALSLDFLLSSPTLGMRAGGV